MMKPLIATHAAAGALNLLSAAVLMWVSHQSFAAGESCDTRSNASRVVVRELAGPLPKGETGTLHWKSVLALLPDWKRSDLALVAFVQDARSGEILRALHAPLCTRP